MGRLDGKVTIITGAGSGIGRATAILFAKEGAKVVVADCVAESGEQTVNMVKEASGEAIFIKTDVSETKDIKNMIKTTVDTYGKLDVLMNNAAILMEEGCTVDCTEEVFDQTIATNLKGVWLGMKYAIPEMLKAGRGSIVNTASIGAVEGLAGIGAYSASKGGVISLSRVTAVEYAAQNIRVNCINPGVIATPMVLASFSSETIRHLMEVTPKARFGEPQEVAHVALFLASDESSWITAQTVVADGGISARHP